MSRGVEPLNCVESITTGNKIRANDSNSHPTIPRPMHKLKWSVSVTTNITIQSNGSHKVSKHIMTRIKSQNYIVALSSVYL